MFQVRDWVRLSVWKGWRLVCTRSSSPLLCLSSTGKHSVRWTSLSLSSVSQVSLSVSPERCTLSSWRWPRWWWWTLRGWGTPDTAVTSGPPASLSSVTTTYRRDCWSITSPTRSHTRWRDTHRYTHRARPLQRYGRWEYEPCSFHFNFISFRSKSHILNNV